MFDIEQGEFTMPNMPLYPYYYIDSNFSESGFCCPRQITMSFGKTISCNGYCGAVIPVDMKMYSKKFLVVHSLQLLNAQRLCNFFLVFNLNILF